MPVAPDIRPELLRGPFRGSTAVAAGLTTWRRLRGTSWLRPVRDVYVWRGIPLTEQVRAQCLRIALPESGFVSGRTAAWLLGVWSPAPGRALPLEHARALDGASGAPFGISRRRLTIRHDAVPELGRHSLIDDLVSVDGVLVTSPLRTCFDLMRERRLVEAVVVVDAFSGSGAVKLPELAAYLDGHRRWPGIRQARVAAGLATAYSRSPGETRLRMVIVLAGFPEPYANIEVRTDRGSRYLDLFLADVPRPTGLEYDGADHEDDDQRQADRRRENELVVGSALSLLRYDRVSVRDERELVVREVAQVTGCEPREALDPGDFRRPPRHLAW